MWVVGGRVEGFCHASRALASFFPLTPTNPTHALTAAASSASPASAAATRARAGRDADEAPMPIVQGVERARRAPGPALAHATQLVGVRVSSCVERRVSGDGGSEGRVAPLRSCVEKNLVVLFQLIRAFSS